MSPKSKMPKHEYTYKTTITFICPSRGEVTEEVEVKVYKRAESYINPRATEEIEELLRQEGVLVEEDDLL